MDYSVIVPVYNEAECLAALCDVLTKVMISLGASYEVIVVDDASTDDTLARLKTLAPAYAELIIVSLKSHRGKSVALQAGFDLARGGVLMTLDGDLQHDPADIPRLLEKLGQGYDMVCGWRRNRQDPFEKQLASALAKAVRRLFMRDPIHDVGCWFVVFKRPVIRQIRLSRGLHRFFAWLAAQRGFRVGEVEVQHHPRSFGVSKYGFWDRLLEGSVDLWRLRTGGLERLMRRPPAYEIKEVTRR